MISLWCKSLAARLPKAFRLPGAEVRVRRIGRGVILEPTDRDAKDIQAIFAEIDDRLNGADFLPEGRPEQPPHTWVDGYGAPYQLPRG